MTTGSTASARFLVFWEQPTDPEAFERHYREVHIPLARKIPALRSYAFNDDLQPVRGRTYFRIAELRWDSMEDLRAAFASPEGKAVGDDVETLEQWAVCRSMVIGSMEELL